MTEAQYRQLVQSAASFQDMDADLQQQILTASGEERERYVRLFENEAAAIGQAVKDFQEQNEADLQGAKIAVKRDQAEQLKAAEQEAAQEDGQTLSSLINNL